MFNYQLMKGQMNEDLIKVIGPFGAGQVADYTTEVNFIPNTFSRIMQRGLFTPRPTSSRTVIIDKKTNTISLLPERPVGAPATRSKAETNDQRAFIAPHYPHEDFIYPRDIQNFRAPGEVMADTLARVRADKMLDIRRKHAQTLEYMMVEAIKGNVVGGSGTTLYNLHTEFGVTPRTVTWNLTGATVNVQNLSNEEQRYIELNTFAGVEITSFWCLCGTAFFDRLINNASVIRAYQNYSSNQEVLRTDRRRNFLHNNVLYEEYNAKVPRLNDLTTNIDFVAADDAYMMPLNVPGMFEVYYAPADKLQYINSAGEEAYLFEYPDPEGRWIKLYSESNPIAINRRPQAVSKITSN